MENLFQKISVGFVAMFCNNVNFFHQKYFIFKEIFSINIFSTISQLFYQHCVITPLNCTDLMKIILIPLYRMRTVRGTLLLCLVLMTVLQGMKGEIFRLLTTKV